MIVTKAFIIALVSAQVGAGYSYCDTHPWDGNCKIDDFESFPAVKVDHDLSGGTEIKTTGAPLPRMRTLGPPPRSLSICFTLMLSTLNTTVFR